MSSPATSSPAAIICSWRDALAGEVLLQRRSARPAHSRGGSGAGGRAPSVAAGEIAARRGAGAGIAAPSSKKLRRPAPARRRAWRAPSRAPRRCGSRAGMAHAGLAGQPLDGLGEGEPLGLHHEGEDVAVLAGGEIEPLALLVIDEEGGGLLRIERRQAGELPALLPQLHLAPDDRRRGQPRADLVEEGVGKAHGVIRSRAPEGELSAWRNEGGVLRAPGGGKGADEAELS